MTGTPPPPDPDDGILLAIKVPYDAALADLVEFVENTYGPDVEPLDPGDWVLDRIGVLAYLAIPARILAEIRAGIALHYERLAAELEAADNPGKMTP